MTLHALEQPGSAYRVVALLTTVVVPSPEKQEGGQSDGKDEEEEARIGSHHVRWRLLQAQAAALTWPLPVLAARVSARPKNGEYEQAVFAALREGLARFPGVGAVAFGDLFLADIRAWREGMVGRFTDRRLRAVFPLWGQQTGALARRCVGEMGFKARLVCVDTTQLDAGFVGREFDYKLLGELEGLGNLMGGKGTVDLCLENGEAHTFVYAGPVFGSGGGVRVVEAGRWRSEDGRFVYCDLVLADEKEGGSGS